MLPPHLSERIEPGAPPPREGAFVMYWMRVAVRAEENAALDVALTAAKHLKLPVFVYHSLSSRYRYASDRLHTFILEGARDVEAALAERGIGYAFHLERPGASERVLESLASKAALVVTDFMPVQPLLKWDDTVAKLAPLWRVDASLVAPVWTADVFERAYSFREARRLAWKERLSAPWPEAPAVKPFLPELPFTPVKLQGASIPELVAACDIDHAVSPVHHSPGGSVAALARWKTFVEKKLPFYAAQRDDPLLEGTSRLSGALHFGFVSALRLAREATQVGGPGAEKFVDELLVWRELAWNFCLHHPKHESVEVLPAWARETLKAHEKDQRSWLPSWEQLARAQTGDLLWDAAQRQLLGHGELHNNVRMTWGKALLKWTRTAQEALTTLVDLNHRYALDGRDPGSYGGILWCLGAFDRPFEPAQPFFGTVRPRHTGYSLAERPRGVERRRGPAAEPMKQRFDVSEYERRVHRPSRGRPLTVAVVGAGVAGLAAARVMKDAGHVVRVFEASELGGRLSTLHEGLQRFDLGVQHFVVKDERFARWARAWWQERLLGRWNAVVEGDAPREHPHELVWLVGTPGMDGVVKRMAKDLDVRLHTEVRGLTRDGTRWRLVDAHGHALGEFDVAVVATPPPVTAELVDPASYELGSRVRAVTTAPGWTVAVRFEQATGVAFDAAFSKVGPLRFIARTSSKPERELEHGEAFVLHATSEWSLHHREEKPEAVLPALLEAFFATSGVKPLEPSFARAVLWKHATVTRGFPGVCHWDEGLRLGLCGVWFDGTGSTDEVEAAFLSGTAVAGRVNALPPGDAEPYDPPPARPVQLTLT